MIGQPDYFYIYLDPRPGDTRCYYGRSIDPARELAARSRGKHLPGCLVSWFSELAALGLEVQLHILETWPEYVRGMSERHEHEIGALLANGGLQILNVARHPWPLPSLEVMQLNACKARAAQTREQHQAIGRAMQARLTPQQRVASGKAGYPMGLGKMTREQRQTIARRVNAKYTDEQLRGLARQMNAKITHEQRVAAGHKGVETRRRNGNDLIGARKMVETRRQNGSYLTGARKMIETKRREGTLGAALASRSQEQRLTAARKAVETKHRRGTDLTGTQKAAEMRRHRRNEP